MVGGIAVAEPIEMLQKVARALGPLVNEVVFIGGAISALLVTDPAAPPIRPTKDVDIVVDSGTHSRHASFEEKLRGRGFQIAAPPICRYAFEDVLVDVMTTSPEAMGFSDQWYPEAFATAKLTKLPNGLEIRVVRSPLFLATKFNAWRDRAEGDYYAQDMEDIIAVIDGRIELLDDIKRSSQEVQAFLAESFAQLLADQRFLDAIPGHMGGGAVAGGRTVMAINVMKEIVDLGQR